jgi:outer membrane protein OmpA-like peptidoglycan-associated protein
MKSYWRSLLTILIGASLWIFYLNIKYRNTKEDGGVTPGPSNGMVINDSMLPPPQNLISTKEDEPPKIIIKFEAGTIQLSQESQKELSKLSNQMSQEANLKAILKGYADNTGTAPKNLELSAFRANAVRATLLRLKVAENRIIAEAHGSENPIADNETEQGRAMNRRVEVQLKKE